jgi:hypothetical protein
VHAKFLSWPSDIRFEVLMAMSIKMASSATFVSVKETNPASTRKVN